VNAYVTNSLAHDCNILCGVSSNSRPDTKLGRVHDNSMVECGVKGTLDLQAESTTTSAKAAENNLGRPGTTYSSHKLLGTQV